MLLMTILDTQKDYEFYRCGYYLGHIEHWTLRGDVTEDLTEDEQPRVTKSVTAYTTVKLGQIPVNYLHISVTFEHKSNGSEDWYTDCKVFSANSMEEIIVALGVDWNAGGTDLVYSPEFFESDDWNKMKAGSVTYAEMINALKGLNQAVILSQFEYLPDVPHYR